MIEPGTRKNGRGRRRRCKRRRAKSNGAGDGEGGSGASGTPGGNGAAKAELPPNGGAVTVGHLLGRLQALRHQGAVAEFLSKQAVEQFLPGDLGPPKLTITNSSDGTERARPEAVLAVSSVLEKEAQRCRQHAAEVLNLIVEEIPVELLLEVQREPHPLAEAYKSESWSQPDEAVPWGTSRAEAPRHAQIGVAGGK